MRGHSNVQGDRTVGITEQPRPAFLDALGTRVRLRAAARARLGHRRRDRGDGAKAGPRCSSAWAATFVSATPDTAATTPPLRHCELTVHVSTKLNRSHLVNMVAMR